jgi:hypothetical protein
VERSDVYKVIDRTAFSLLAYAGYRFMVDALADVIAEVIRQTYKDQTKEPDELSV